MLAKYFFPGRVQDVHLLRRPHVQEGLNRAETAAAAATAASTEPSAAGGKPKSASSRQIRGDSRPVSGHQQH